ncbi:anti-sigma factor [Nocardioides insulae]|uniref:anti-sigma factor n=1 Tax=Nocardioides insulae TaxID=394734 RepID=UPI000406875B|nr:anti-sigma factor [Nocardioides insulae]
MNGVNPEAHTLVGPYVLDALEPEERAEFERHLSLCAACRDEVAALREATAALAADLSFGSGPPERVRERVLAAAAQTPQLPPLVAARRPTSRRSRALRWAVGAAAAVVLAVTGGILAQPLLEDEPAPMTAAQVMAAPDARMHEMDTSEGDLMVAMSPEMHMVAVDTAAMAEEDGMVYQVWWVTPEGAESAAVLEGADAAAVPMGEGELQVTMEPAPGSSGPTSDPLVTMDADEL